LHSFVGPVEAFPCSYNHEGKQKPIEGPDHTKGEAGHLMILLQPRDWHQEPDDI
jgi:hypothetical protein